MANLLEKGRSIKEDSIDADGNVLEDNTVFRTDNGTIMDAYQVGSRVAEGLILIHIVREIFSGVVIL